jgi:hypothetical protein
LDEEKKEIDSQLFFFSASVISNFTFTTTYNSFALSYTMAKIKKRGQSSSIGSDNKLQILISLQEQLARPKTISREHKPCANCRFHSQTFDDYASSKVRVAILKLLRI